MRVTFGIDFDHGHWPGPLHERDAVAGEVWVGPAGLLGLLETALGLGRPPQSALLRAASLIGAVTRNNGFWSQTAEVDPLGAAQTLLEWRDELWLAGWRAEPLTEWLRQLALATEDAPPGFADRLEEVATALERRSAYVEEITLFDDPHDLPRVWRDVLSGLEAQGTKLSSAIPPSQTAPRNLGDVQSGQAPTQPADDTFQLLRPYGAITAADATAAWLAQQPDLNETLVVDGDHVLDSALQRFGLPTLGRMSRGQANPVLQVLPLAVRLAWDPPSPQVALDLLNLPVSPIPRGLSFRLTRAIAEWPSVQSEVWQERLEEGLKKLEDEAYRAETAECIETLFTPSVSRHTRYPVSELDRRLALVRSWAQKQVDSGSHAAIPWRSVLEQCGLLSALVESSELNDLSPAQLSRFVAEATRACRVGSPYRSQAGLGSVGRPGCVVGPARRVVWWNFDTQGAAPVRRWPLPPESRLALESSGIFVPDATKIAEARAARWRRPLAMASEALFLVCPRTTDDGQDRYPHPLWDELLGKAGSSLTRSVVTSPMLPAEPPTESVPHLEPPQPRRDWHAPPELLPPRESESPSSLGSLFGCSLQWALKYRGGLRAGREVALQSLPMLKGNILHEVVERTLQGGTTAPDQAADRAVEFFDELGPRVATPLFLPGMEAECASVRADAAKAAHRLQEILNLSGLHVKASEEWREKEAFGQKVGGYLDLELGDPPAVIDLKLGGAKWRREALTKGTYEDLVLYSYTIRDDESGALPSVGYFILSEQVLLTTEGASFGAGEEIEGPAAAEVWAALGESLKLRRDELGAGRLVAPGNTGENGEEGPEEDELADGRIIRRPPCRFCDFSALCGRLFTGESA